MGINQNGGGMVGIYQNGGGMVGVYQNGGGVVWWAFIRMAPQITRMLFVCPQGNEFLRDVFQLGPPPLPTLESKASRLERVSSVVLVLGTFQWTHTHTHTHTHTKL